MIKILPTYLLLGLGWFLLTPLGGMGGRAATHRPPKPAVFAFLLTKPAPKWANYEYYPAGQPSGPALWPFWQRALWGSPFQSAQLGGWAQNSNCWPIYIYGASPSAHPAQRDKKLIRTALRVIAFCNFLFFYFSIRVFALRNFKFHNP